MACKQMKPRYARRKWPPICWTIILALLHLFPLLVRLVLNKSNMRRPSASFVLAFEGRLGTASSQKTAKPPTPPNWTKSFFLLCANGRKQKEGWSVVHLRSKINFEGFLRFPRLTKDIKTHVTKILGVMDDRMKINFRFKKQFANLFYLNFIHTFVIPVKIWAS